MTEGIAISLLFSENERSNPTHTEPEIASAISETLWWANHQR